MKRVFLSYSRDDSETVRQLVASLRDTELAGWLDDSDISTEQVIKEKVRGALREASAVVVLVSEQSLKSPWVNFEIGAAWGMGKRILPILIGKPGTERTLPTSLHGVTYVDARGRSLQEVAAEVARTLSIEKPPSQGVVTVTFQISDISGSLAKVLRSLADAKYNILVMSTRLEGKDRLRVDMTIQVPDARTTSQVDDLFRSIPDIVEYHLLKPRGENRSPNT